MSIVIDASVAVSWFVTESSSETNHPLMFHPEPLLAPELLLVEFTNALVRRALRQEFPDDKINETREELGKLRILLVDNDALLATATRIALLSRHSLYDCIYLALAYEQSAKLATDDKELIALASNMDPPIPIWRPTLA